MTGKCYNKEMSNVVNKYINPLICIQLSTKIAAMEEASLDPKSWQMSGEITSKMRPENSLLEEHVTFEHTTRLGKIYSCW